MPVYEYACGKCEHEFEVEQRISDDPVKTCPACRSRRVKRLISRTSFVLKGSGWYSDLYSSSKSDAAKPEAAKPDKSDKSDGETKSSNDAVAAKAEPAKGDAKSDGAKPKSQAKGKPKAA